MRLGKDEFFRGFFPFKKERKKERNCPWFGGYSTKAAVSPNDHKSSLMPSSFRELHIMALLERQVCVWEEGGGWRREDGGGGGG